MSQSKMQTRTKANVRQMFCRFKVKNDTLCKSSVITDRNFYHFPFLFTLVLAAAPGAWKENYRALWRDPILMMFLASVLLNQ